MNKIKNSLEGIRLFVKKYLNPFKYGRNGCVATVGPISLGLIIANALVEPDLT